MNGFRDFALAALPWVAIGLALAIFLARGAAGQKDGKKPQTADWGTEGMCLGMCLGTALSSALGSDTGSGISLGMLIGLALGSCIRKGGYDGRTKDENGTEKEE